MIEIIFSFQFYIYCAISNSNKLINKFDFVTGVKNCDFFERIMRILPANIMSLVVSLEANESR